jgi:hypothetical protein
VDEVPDRGQVPEAHARFLAAHAQQDPLDFAVTVQVAERAPFDPEEALNVSVPPELRQQAASPKTSVLPCVLRQATKIFEGFQIFATDFSWSPCRFIVMRCLSAPDQQFLSE